jgi:hypothetical protein
MVSVGEIGFSGKHGKADVLAGLDLGRVAKFTVGGNASAANCGIRMCRPATVGNHFESDENSGLPICGLRSLHFGSQLESVKRSGVPVKSV